MVIVDNGQAPTFSPDGSKIIYHGHDGTDGLALFTATFTDTGGIPNLGASTKVNGTEAGGAPDWQPTGV